MTRLKLFLICFLLLAPSVLSAANYYVRVGATGSNDGSDWTNAWHDFDHITGLVAGDTVWIAGGTYTAQNLTMTTSGNADTNAGRIFYKRCLVTDTTSCASAAGWSASYDSQIILQDKSIDLDDKSYITIDGRVANGIRIYHPTWSMSLVKSTEAAASLSYITLRYLQLEGKGDQLQWPATPDTRGIDITPDNPQTSSNILIEYCDIFNVPTYLDLGGTNITIQYNTMHGGRNAPGWTDNHENAFYVWGGTNIVFRFNYAYNYSGEGVFFTGITGHNVDGFHMYGNVMYDGQKAADNYGAGPNALLNFKVYNNTFSNLTYTVSYENTGDTGEYKNNIEHACTSGVFVNTGATVAQATNWVGASDPGFVNLAGKNFRLLQSATALIDQGSALGSPYNSDTLGTSRPQGAAWDIGAMEYVSYPQATIGVGPIWSIGAGATATIH